MSYTFKLEGTENLKRIFKDFPEEGYKKPLNAAFRKAAEPVKKAMISSIPQEILTTSKAVKIRSYKSDDPLVAVGVFRKGVLYQNRRGINWNPYMLLYWFNYGTYANRASDHTFVRQRSKLSLKRKGGIKPGKFFEKAWDSSSGAAQKSFEDNADKEVIKFFNKYKFR